jgi:hypothetical protein
MCRQVTCRTCGGTTWDGCGMHAADVMRDVPTHQRCSCQTPTPPTRRFGLRLRKG